MLSKTILLAILIAIVTTLYSQGKNDNFSAWIDTYDSREAGNTFETNKEELNNLLAVSVKYKNDTARGDVLRRLGLLFQRQGIYDSAIYYYLLSIKYSTNINDEFSSASNYNQIGIIYYHLKKWDEALKYFIKAYSINNKILIYKSIADIGGNISEIYTLRRQFDSALYYANNSLHARRKSKDTSQIGRNYYAIGYAYEGCAKFDLAIHYYTIAFESTKNIPDITNFIQTLNGLGRVNLNIKHIDSSIKYHNKALDIAFKYPNQPLLAETYEYLSKAYEQKGDSSKAYFYLKHYILLSNKILDSTVIKYIADAETYHRTKEAEIQVVEQNRINTELKADKERQTLWMAILISIIISIVIISALIIWINYNKRRLAQKEAELQSQKVNDLLQKQEVENVNAMLKGQDAERKRIAQELHDRLGSILSTVKLHFSVVEEQMNALKQQQHQSYGEATLLLDEAVDEVRRISHDLYEGSLAKFGFKTALLQLIAAIEKANTVKILFIDNGVDESFYKNHAQELYRITQELLSNTLKYSGATEITLQLSLKENTFDFMYEDNGNGFDKKYTETGGGIGYKNIAARVAKLNGNWHLDTHPGHGMTLLIEIPV